MSTLASVIQRGTAAAQPAATAVPVGTLYFQTDTFLLQRSSGTAWETFSAVVLVGDSGAGGTRGLVPAPGAGDAAAGKFLKANATWDVPTSSGAKLIQVKNTITGANANNNSVIPFDDTIPQNTEGSEYMSLAITPTSATNILKIDVVVFLSSLTANWLIAALFQDSTANALATQATHMPTATAGCCIAFTHWMLAGTTSATTFKVRCGRDASSGTTVSFNGTSSARKFGGVFASSITISEIVP